MHPLLIVTGAALGLLFTGFALISLREHESRAALRSLTAGLSVAMIFYFASSLEGPAGVVTGSLLLSLTFTAAVILIIPVRRKPAEEPVHDQRRYDERFTMFSRLELTHRPGEYKNFYDQNPHLKEIDDAWQRKPGLMSSSASFYDPLIFNAATATFYTIERLRPCVSGEQSPERISIDPYRLTRFIKRWVKELGAVSVGICETKAGHYYSRRGRGEAYGEEVVRRHKYAIALTVEMDKEMLATGPAGPALMESASQYLRSGTIAIQLARFLLNLGFDSRAHIDGNYEVICPLTARDAGLGEIGRMGLLMTPELGPRVRIAVVTTDAPLVMTGKKSDHTVQQFCEICKKCAEACPARAIPGTGRSMDHGSWRWQTDHEKCFGYWCTSGTDCGRCMSVCPYSHPNNFFHNMVRSGIKNSLIFQRIALMADDFFYGRKPRPASVPEWMTVK